MLGIAHSGSAADCYRCAFLSIVSCYSASIVTEFFGYSINSILYQRGIYEPESFTKVQKYGLGMQVTTDVGLADYLKKVLTQMQGTLRDSDACSATEGELKRRMRARGVRSS
jgi:hypothetical protein